MLATLRGAATPSLSYLLLHGFDRAAYAAITDNLRDVGLIEKFVVHGSSHVLILLMRRLYKLLQLDVQMVGISLTSLQELRGSHPVCKPWHNERHSLCTPARSGRQAARETRYLLFALNRTAL